MWNTAIWRKTWGDQSLLGLAFAVLWAAFPWLYIGLSSQIEMNAFQDVLLRAIPEDWQKMSGVPFSEVATHVGRVALAFVDPVVVLTATVWGVTRGSDAVSGQLERGTLEMILAQPVRRRTLFNTSICNYLWWVLSLRGLICISLHCYSIWSLVGQSESPSFPACCIQRLRAHGMHEWFGHMCVVLG